MEIIKKISDREKKLLIVFITLAILIASFRFGFQHFTDKEEKLSNMNQELTSILKDLQEKNANKNKYVTEVEEMNSKVEEIISEFPAGITQEKSTMFVTYLEDYADMKISSISFDDTSVFYTSNQDNLETQNLAVETSNLDEINSTANVTSVDVVDQKPKNNVNITGYKSAITLTYQTTYEGFKKCIDYINQYEDKMNITNLSAAFDNTTGNLTGTITIQMYALNGTDKEYVEPIINVADIGTDNIFGTFEIPLAETEIKKESE